MINNDFIHHIDVVSTVAVLRTSLLTNPRPNGTTMCCVVTVEWLSISRWLPVVAWTWLWTARSHAVPGSPALAL